MNFWSVGMSHELYIQLLLALSFLSEAQVPMKTRISADPGKCSTYANKIYVVGF
jgi:hypothetical protein